MAAFLEQLAEALWAEHGAALGRVAVVLPSQRAGLYLRHALARRAGSALWSPEIFTLASFMERLSGLRTLPAEELLFEAYEAYRTVAGADLRSFEEFIAWAPVTLADISETDAHVVHLQGFYRDLRSWEELEWSFNVVPLSDGQQRMVRYWTLAGKLHVALNERLLAAKSGTMGLVERTAATQDAPFSWERMWFAGLNAFTPAEQRVIDRAHDEGLARFAWDADHYYVDAAHQESGDHLRAAIKRYGAGLVPLGNTFATGDLQLQVMQAPNPAAQAWCAADLLAALAPEERARTAVVLADEGLLPALLEALPEEAGPVNITMGLSLAQLPVGSLVGSFFRAQTSRHPDGSWYVTDLEHLLRHPYLRRADASFTLDPLLQRLRDARMLTISTERVQAALEGMGEDIAAHARVVFGPTQADDRHARLIALLAWAQRCAIGDGFASEQIYQASVVLRRVHVLLDRFGHSADPQAWSTVLSRLLRSARVGLFGEPLSGLQVMGLLEARALDHHRVILLGAQEGKLPSSSADRSYIPFELRRAYGLPLRDSSDAVQAYNFLRMLQRASEAVLVYADDGTANGPSRYIAQLEHELFRETPSRLVFTDARIPIPQRVGTHVRIARTEATQAAIRERLAKGLSPTLLRTWLKCPLDFWFRYVQGLKEPEEPGARIASNVLGDALHGVIEDIYKPWLGKPLIPAELRAAANVVPDALHERMLKQVPDALLRKGQPLLQMGMATRAAEAFLRAEADAVERGITLVPNELERELMHALDPSHQRFAFPVNVKGRLDRIDTRDGLVHILDLKTGRVDEKALAIKEISFEALRGDRGYAAQLLVYAWLWFTEHPEVASLRTGVLPFQRSTAREGAFLRVDGDDIIHRHMLPAINEMLLDAVASMMDPSQGFAHDTKSRYCVFCAFTS
jgi:ATP-dependent helicase/nuclease subunit B